MRKRAEAGVMLLLMVGIYKHASPIPEPFAAFGLSLIIMMIIMGYGLIMYREEEAKG